MTANNAAAIIAMRIVFFIDLPPRSVELLVVPASGARLAKITEDCDFSDGCASTRATTTFVGATG